MVQIALMDDFQQVALAMAPWDTIGPGAAVRAFPDHVSDESALADRLRDMDVIMAMRERTPFPASLLGRLPNLKLLVTAGMRNAAIDVEAATAQGILVCGTEGGSQATAELTWGLILALLRRIPHEYLALRSGRWQTTVGTGLAGKTLGIIGLGNIGSQVARIGQAFQMRVIAWSQNLTAERARECGADRVAKDELLRQSDILTLHTRLSARTQGLLGAAELAAMKPTAVLINTSRGPLVDESALLSILRKRGIAGAALDVFDEEPLPGNHPLLKLDNVVATPHLGYVTDERLRMFYGHTLENISAWLMGSPRRVLNPAVLPHRRRP